MYSMAHLDSLVSCVSACSELDGAEDGSRLQDPATSKLGTVASLLLPGCWETEAPLWRSEPANNWGQGSQEMKGGPVNYKGAWPIPWHCAEPFA
jgi:hypothetical protein